MYVVKCIWTREQKQHKSLTIEENIKLIQRKKKGKSRSYVCHAFNLVPPTVTTVMKNAETTKESSQA
jgi:hypothetical protein